MTNGGKSNEEIAKRLCGSHGVLLRERFNGLYCDSCNSIKEILDAKDASHVREIEVLRKALEKIALTGHQDCGAVGDSCDETCAMTIAKAALGIEQ